MTIIVQAGLGGLSFDEGQFSVFGQVFLSSLPRTPQVCLQLIIFLRLITVSKYRYTTAGREVLRQVKTGDVIQSAKLVEGQDRLILPPAEN